MTFIVPAVLGGLAITVMALVSLAAARKGKHPAASDPVAQPRILIHSINDDRCTGCDACVAVCPTNVLDLVENKSRVLRFQDCIQCEQCMWACPTEALVMHLEGTEPPPLEVPELDPSFQTAVPGQYLIGEVAGKPLVKNAANLGRMVVEHMLRDGLRPGALSNMGDPSAVDVVVVGSGPGGLSAGLTCIQRGLSYVVLEKEQLVASTVARYPKGKLVMAEPYDVRNLSLLPVFDSSKEQIVPLWRELVERVGMQIRLGEAVEEVGLQPDGSFSVRTTVGTYRAQRVVLATGTRGKPRTLGVAGENLPKVQNLLDDPDEFRGRPVIVVGGGDSAVEAAIALADAGARVILSYRGRAFNRAAPKNKQAIESYEAQRRVKIRYQSNIIEFTQDTVTLEMINGQRKTYPNDAGFVLIGSDPPIKWLQKLGVQFVHRPHAYQMGKTDDLVSAFLGNQASACPEDVERAAAQVQGLAIPQGGGMQAPQVAQSVDNTMSRPRKWLRSATAIFTSSHDKLEKPMKLSEFAKRARKHTGHGRRDALDPSERTRVLRMLRDVGGRIADEESRIDIRAVPPASHYGDNQAPEYLDDPIAPAPPPAVNVAGPEDRTMGLNISQAPKPAFEEITPKPAVIVGLDRARASRKQKDGHPVAKAAKPPQAPSPPPPPPRRKRPSQQPVFVEEPTRQVDADSALAQLLRNQSRKPDYQPQAQVGYGNQHSAPPYLQDDDDDDDPTTMSPFDEPTRAVNPDEMFRTGGIVKEDDSLANTIDLDGANPTFDEDPTRAIDVNRLGRGQPAPPRRKKIRYPERREAPPAPRRRDQYGAQSDGIGDIDWDLD